MCAAESLIICWDKPVPTPPGGSEQSPPAPARHMISGFRLGYREHGIVSPKRLKITAGTGREPTPEEIASRVDIPVKNT